MPKLISLVGAKGGTLKTASVAALAHLAARAGMSVVMVDGDPQADLTSRSGHARVADPLTAEAVPVRYLGEPDLALRLLRGGRSMEGVDLHGASRQLARAGMLGADLVLVDTPPALGPVTIAAIRYSDLVIVPAVPGKESLERINDVLGVAAANSSPPVRVLVTLALKRSILARWMQGEIDRLYPGLRLEHVVPVEMAAGEAALYERPVTAYAPRSANAAVFRAVADEVFGLLEIGGSAAAPGAAA